MLLVGHPGSGKSKIASLLLEMIGGGIRHYDIDDVRVENFGKPADNDGTDPEIKARDDREMAGVYNIMLGKIDGFLRAEHPLMITCTLSSKKWGQDRVLKICSRYPNAKVGVVWCCPDITKDQLAERFQNRDEEGYLGATQSVDRAWELRERYEPIVMPNHLKLDTGPAHTPEECVKLVLDYILS